MMLNLTPLQLLTTTRSVRKRLDLRRPVPLDVVKACIEIAVQAPSGSNSQGWQFVIVTDAGKKQAIADLYRRAWRKYAGIDAGAAQEPQPANTQAANTQEKVRSSADYLAVHLQDVPVWLIPCINGRVNTAPGWQQAGQYGSILPAAWSFMLAARLHGLASCWTTLHLMYEREAAEILRIPFEAITQTALIPVAYPIGGDFKPAPRKTLDGLVHLNGWHTSN